MTSATILVADDDAAIRTVLNQALSRAGYDVRITSNAATLWRWISAGDGDMVITDVVMPDENAFDLLPRIKKLRPDLPVLVMSAQNTFMTAIKASEKGAYDYLPKPFDLTELIAIVGRALAEPKRRPARQDDDAHDGMPLVGRSAAMQEIYRVMARLMGSHVAMVNAVGEDAYGEQTIANLAGYGVDTTHVRRVSGSSGVAPIWVEADGSNRIIIIPGANRGLRPEDATAAVTAQDRLDAVIGQFEIDQAVTAAGFRAASVAYTYHLHAPGGPTS